MLDSIHLVYIGLIKSVLFFVPKKLRYHVARFLYNYDSKRITGKWMVVNYLPEMKLLMIVNSKEYIGWNILFRGVYEAKENELIKSIVKPGHVVIEAGANIGSETLLLAKLVHNGKVFAFEPLPAVSKYLKANIAINQLDAIVSVEEFALTDTTGGLIDFHILNEDEANQGMGSIYPHSSAKQVVHVPQLRLDDWLVGKNLHRLDFIKIDIQGAEINLLNGAKNAIDRFRPILFLEADPNSLIAAGRSLEDLFDCITALGYQVSLIGDSEPKALLRKQLLPGNWLATPIG